MRARVEWATEEERARIVDAALDLLETVGMQFGEGDAIKALAAAGALVDRERGVARLPRELVEEALLPRRRPRRRDARGRLPPDRGRPPLHQLGLAACVDEAAAAAPKAG